MEKNTVLLSLEGYNELRDYQIKMSKGYVEVSGNCGLRMYFTTKDKAIKKIAGMNVDLYHEILELKAEIAGKPKEFCLTDIQKMSILQFIKWRKNG